MSCPANLLVSHYLGARKVGFLKSLLIVEFANMILLQDVLQDDPSNGKSLPHSRIAFLFRSIWKWFDGELQSSENFRSIVTCVMTQLLPITRDLYGQTSEGLLNFLLGSLKVMTYSSLTNFLDMHRDRQPCYAS